MTVDKLWIAGAKLEDKLLVIKFDWLVKHRYYGLKLNDSEELKISNGNIRFTEIGKNDYEIALFGSYEFNSDIHKGCGSITLDIEDQAQYIIRADENILRVYKMPELINAINQFKITPGGSAVAYKIDLPIEIKDKLNKLNRRLRLVGSDMEYKMMEFT